jgi:Asp-tRNA(Asn)/Glu-tRNA(Gln) amidotransferase B subunit
MNEFARSGVNPDRVENPDELAKIIDAKSRLPREALEEAVATSASSTFTAVDFLKESMIADASELDPVIDAILVANPGQVEAYRGGKEGLLGFFVGQVMKETHGRADPRAVNERLREKLGA